MPFSEVNAEPDFDKATYPESVVAAAPVGFTSCLVGG